MVSRDSLVGRGGEGRDGCWMEGVEMERLF